MGQRWPSLGQRWFKPGRGENHQWGCPCPSIVPNENPVRVPHFFLHNCMLLIGHTFWEFFKYCRLHSDIFRAEWSDRCIWLVIGTWQQWYCFRYLLALQLGSEPEDEHESAPDWNNHWHQWQNGHSEISQLQFGKRFGIQQHYSGHQSVVSFISSQIVKIFLFQCAVIIWICKSREITIYTLLLNNDMFLSFSFL